MKNRLYPTLVSVLVGISQVIHIESKQPYVAFPNASANSPQKPTPQTSPGWIVVEDTIWMRFLDEPTNYMVRALETFDKHNFYLSSRETRLASGSLYIAARNGQSKTKEALYLSAQQLDELATRIQTEQTITRKSMERVFAKAARALAEDHTEKAKVSLEKNERKNAGQYLHAAVTSLEQASKWSGRELKSQSTEIVKDIRIVSGKMIEGSAFAVKEVNKAIVWLGKELQEFGTK